MVRKKKLVISFILFIVLVMVICGCAHNVQFGRDGSGSAEVFIDKATYADKIAMNGSAQAYFQQVIRNMNLSSGDEDILEVRSLVETDTEYILQIGYRRIDNIKGIGDFEWSGFSSVSEEGNQLGARISSYSRGNLRCTVQRNYDGDIGTVDIEAGSLKNEKYITPLTSDGTQCTVEEFFEASSASKDRLVMFRMLDTQGIRKIKFNLQGTVSFYSSEGMNLLSESEIELVPEEYIVNLTKYEVMKDSEGNPVYDENGSVVKEPVYHSDIAANCIIGYFVFTQSVSSVLVGFLVVVGVLIVALLIWCIVKGKFSAFFKSQTFRMVRMHKLLYVMLIPGLVFLIIFAYLPMFGLLAAFQEFRLTEGFFGSEFVGLKYFVELFQAKDETVYRIFRNTIYISVIRIATNFPMILLFALLLNGIGNRYVKSIVQTMSYMPNFVSWVVVGGMMFSLFSVDQGAINQILASFGIEPIHWYAESEYWWWILAITSLWKSMGWGTIIYMSALGSIDNELYDACMIDGGGTWRKITTVTLPGIMNIVMLQLILDAGNVMRDNYEQILAVTNGSAALHDRVTVIGSITFNAALSGSGLSVSTALGLVQGLIGLVLVMLVNNVAKKSGNAGIM